jgi:hypothetical protein
MIHAVAGYYTRCVDRAPGAGAPCDGRAQLDSPALHVVRSQPTFCIA